MTHFHRHTSRAKSPLKFGGFLISLNSAILRILSRWFPPKFMPPASDRSLVGRWLFLVAWVFFDTDPPLVFDRSLLVSFSLSLLVITPFPVLAVSHPFRKHTHAHTHFQSLDVVRVLTLGLAAHCFILSTATTTTTTSDIIL